MFCAFSWTLFLLSVFFLILMGFCFILYFIIIPQMSVCFLMGGKKRVDPYRRGGGEEPGRETIIRIHLMGKNLSILKNENSKETKRG